MRDNFRDPPFDPSPLGRGSVDPEPYEPSLVQGANTASGRVNLILPALKHARPLSFLNVCSWRSATGAPSPVALLVSVDSQLGSPLYAQERVVLSQLSGVSLMREADPCDLGGVMRISYGIGAQQRVLEADIRAGSYQLPPCDHAQFDAFLFLKGPANFWVAGGIVPGVLPSSSRFTASVRPTLLPTDSVTEPVPFGARWVALAGGNPSGIGTGQPILKLSQGASSVFLMHDYDSGAFLSQPGQPVEIFNREAITLTNDGPATAAVTARFFLEV